ncbi:MAG: NADH-quinone oxidoreductase subunit NuoK [Bdellovibrionales bacterium]|nr:NADH-quinone oxidoreductase subunit NuoK [Bdellovibrionales bacterium]
MNGEIQPMMMVVVALIVFGIGLFGLLIRKNLLIMLMCIELMLNSVNLCFVAFSKMHQSVLGDLTVLFVMTVAAAESAVGLGLVIAMFRTLKSVDTDQIQILRD